MNKNDLVMLIMAKKTLDYQKDPNPDNWVTISGAKVHLDEGGKIDGGAKGKFNGKSYSGTKKSRKSATGSSESSKKYESKAREAVEYWVNTHYKNPSDKNIKDSVESVRMQMESMVKSAERNLNDAKKTGKEDLIKKYQDKFDEAKGTLEALNNYYDGGTVKKVEEPKLGAPKMAESKKDFPLKEKNDDFYKKQAQATMRHWLIQKHMENTAANKREIADEVRHDVEFWAEQWKRNYEIAKQDSRYTEKEVASLKEKADGAQKELEWFNKLWPKKEPKKSAPKSAGKEERDFIGIKAESKTGETIKVTPSNKRKIEEDLIDDYYLMKYADKISDGINKKNRENGKKDIKDVVDYRPTSIDVKGVKKVQDEVYGDDVAEVTYVVELEDHSVGHSGKKIRKTITQRMENLPPYKEDFYFG